MVEFKKIRNNLIEDEEQNLKDSNWFCAIGIFLTTFLVCIVVLSTFVFMNISVSGNSMNKTLNNGDIVIANKLKQAEHGDIVILSDAKKYGEKWLIKRVIGLEGDTVMIKEGKVFLNGKELNEPYAYGATYAFGVVNEGMSISLKENEIFYLGDNREYSADSRIYGVCTIENVVCVVEDWSLNARHITNKLFAIFSHQSGQ